jgi:hypothetical protein
MMAHLQRGFKQGLVSEKNLNLPSKQLANFL